MRINVDDRVYLSEIQPSDKAAYVEHLQDKEIYERTLRIPRPYTEAHAEQWLASVAQASEPVKWAIRRADGFLIGGLGFQDLIKSHRAEVGYWLAKPYWGRGIMTAVVRNACDFAFHQWQLVKLTAHVASFNIASARVLEKNGFEPEGYLKKHVLKDGKFLDIKLYGLLRT